MHFFYADRSETKTHKILHDFHVLKFRSENEEVKFLSMKLNFLGDYQHYSGKDKIP